MVKKKSSYLSSLLSDPKNILIIVLVAISAYFVGANKESLGLYGNDTSKEVIDETANWKAYISKKWGFSLKYPNKFMPCLNFECNSDTDDELQLNNILFKEGLYVKPYKNLTGLTSQQIGKRAYSCNLAKNSVSNLNENEIFLGLPSYEFDLRNGFCDMGYLIDVKEDMPAMINGSGGEAWILEKESHVIFVEKNGIIYRIIYSKTSEFDQILSTFKFTN